MTKPGSVTQKEIERACKGVRDSGLQIKRVTVIDGQIEITIDSDDETENDAIAEDRRKLREKIHGKQG